MAKGILKTSGFKMNNKDIDILVKRLQNVAEKSTRAARHRMEDGVNDTVELAKKYAPVDKGDLESAIKVGDSEKGARGRKIFVIEVDETVVNSRGRSVGKYATPMHEGQYNLGKKSLEKANALGVEVGRKYLERAFDESVEEIEKNLQDAYKRGLK